MNGLDGIIEKLRDVIKRSAPKTSAYDTQAIVTRVEGDTAWVHIPGGIDETPVKMTISAKAGDTVQVRVGGGRAWLTGNATAPPTDDTASHKAVTLASTVNRFVQKLAGDVERTEEVAVQAGKTAVIAMQSADGKSTVYHSATEPTGGTYQIGDTWFNESEGYAIYTWDGTDWVKEELGEDAIADLSITNAKIANATIQSGKIAALDAGKITSGTIDTARLNVQGIITSGGIATTSDIPTDVSDLNNDAGYQTASDVSTAVSGKADTDDAVMEEQTIYKQAVAGTGSVSGTTTWVTETGESTTSDTSGLTPVWTLKRPTYRSNYPILFVAKQMKKVDGTVTCTTPIKDDTTTIIDGGHITTGMIDASYINVSQMKVGDLQNDVGYITSGDVGKWYTGTAMTYTDSSPHIYTNSGITNAIPGDMYLNTSTDNVYLCTTGGTPSVAQWTYATNIGGDDGKGIQSTSSYKSGGTTYYIITYTDGTSTTLSIDDGEDITSRYVTTITGRSGITVHDANDTSNYANVNSNGLQVVKSGSGEVASFGSDITLGATSGQHIKIDPTDGVLFYKTQSGSVVYGGGIHVNPLPNMNSLIIGASTTINLQTSKALCSGIIDASNGFTIGNYALFKIVQTSVDNLTVSTSDGTDISITPTAQSGYTPIAVVGYDLDNASSGGVNASMCNIFRCQLSSGKAELQARCRASSNAKVKVKVDVLYARTELGISIP